MEKHIDLSKQNHERHECQSELDGDWIVFTCEKCDYVREINWKSGEMNVSGGDLNVMHEGAHFPMGINPDELKNQMN